MKSHTITLAGNPELQDRLSIFTAGNKTIVALADGAGGMSGGAQAAQFLIDQTRRHLSALHNPTDCETLLHRIDRELAGQTSGGQSTGIILVLDQAQLFGASVGDSEAWIFDSGQKTLLTKGQFRKPFLGSGEALAVSFSLSSPQGILVVASDGLWKYTSYEKVAEQVQEGMSENLLERLASLVRLRSGALQDDIAIAAVAL